MKIFWLDSIRANVVKWIDARSAWLLMRLISNRGQKYWPGLLPANTSLYFVMVTNGPVTIVIGAGIHVVTLAAILYKCSQDGQFIVFRIF